MMAAQGGLGNIMVLCSPPSREFLDPLLVPTEQPTAQGLYILFKQIGVNRTSSIFFDAQIKPGEAIILNKTTDVYEWINTSLLPPLVALENYNGQYHNLEDQAFTDELTDYRIMPLQIRQLRVLESKTFVSCIIKVLRKS